ncbi:MAG: GFA family protein [Rhizobiaceae bacterium]
MKITGACNCGNVRYSIDGKVRPIVACHCRQCRKQTGHYYAATNVLDTDLKIIDAGSLKWYEASDTAKRGFCGECGSALFWKRNESTTTSVLAGSLDGEPGLEMESHIFVEDKGDYYEITDGLPQHAQSDNYQKRS